ncbi:MAG: hypothetical protein J6N15_12305 [Ruminiclostridium sp.]|nr:hypothetical protein [Ruminiclostridium sp.]
MRTLKKMILCGVLLAVSGCTDISTTVRQNTAPTAAKAKTTTVTAATEDTTEPPEDDDDDDIELILPDSFVTTAESARKTETFPVQSSAETSPETEPPVTAAATETTTAATTAAATAETTVTTAATTTAAATSAAQTSAAAHGEISYNVIGENGILVSYQDGHYRGLMACFGTYGLCERWAGAVNTFAKKLPGVNVYTMAAPISSEFYTPQKFWDSGFTVSQYNKCEHIRECLDGVTWVDAYSALKSHKDEDIYARTDHHWNPLGAYYAAQKFAEAAGVDFPELDKYTPVSRSGYVGSMYTYSKDYHLYNDAETFTMYISPNADRISTTYYNTGFGGAYSGDLFVSRNAASFYCSFIGSDNRITRIDTDVKNGRTLVVFKQSFGNALIPFLTSGFEHIYVGDMRYFDLNAVQFCKDVGATDLLCTDCVMIAAGNGGKYLELLINK